MSINICTFNQVYYSFLSKKFIYMYYLYDLLKNISLCGKLNEHQYI